MLEILCFDICALAILIVLMFAFSFRNMSKEDAGRKLVALIVFTIVASVFDIAANYYNGVHGRKEINYTCSGIYYVMRNLAYYMYAVYIVAITGSWKISRSKIIKLIKYIPLIVIIFIVFSTPVNQAFYYYGEDNMYIRGPLFGIVYVCSAIYLLYALYYTVVSVKIIGSKKALSLVSCAVFSVVAAIIQFYRPYLYVDILGFTLSLLYIVLLVDNPGDKVDPTSLLLKYEAYINELRIVCFTSRPVDIVHINIKNNRIIEQMLSYYNYSDFIRILADRLRELNSKNRFNAKLYYVKNGGFRVIIEGYSYGRTAEFARLALDEFSKEVSVRDMEVNVEASVCITSIPKDFNIIDDLFAFGSVAAEYEEAGKIVYTKDILKSDTYSINSNADKIIERGILYNHFEVYYQPILNVRTGKFTEAEALLRLRDEENNIILPELFIEAAEQNGSIYELEKIVLQDVCGFISSEEIKDTDIECINVNLSVIECLQKNLSGQILRLFEEYGISTEKICFEIRESLASDKQKTFEENIRILSDAGVKFTLDDYGTGYSNITTIATMPIDKIKFDREFTNTNGNERLEEILNNSIDMVKGLNRKIVIEGVETEASANRFKALECDYIQGFYYAKPMTRKKLIEFYKYNESKDYV